MAEMMDCLKACYSVLMMAEHLVVMMVGWSVAVMVSLRAVLLVHNLVHKMVVQLVQMLVALLELSSVDW